METEVFPAPLQTATERSGAHRVHCAVHGREALLRGRPSVPGLV